MNTLQEKILALKQEKNALILAHYYQRLEVQDLADYVGASFALAQKAQPTDCDVIVMCGVRFMAESAKIGVCSVDPHYEDREMDLKGRNLLSGLPQKFTVSTEELLEPVAKTVALSILTKLTAEICRSAGESGLASFVELGGTVAALVVALPLMRAVAVLMAEMLT